MKFNKVVIVGTGLIGGSIALALKKKKLAKEICGISRHKESLILAKKQGIIDSGSQDINIVQGADLVVLAVPVNTILRLSPSIAAIINTDCLVFDVGSTKKEIVGKLDKIFANYIGAHPLAGSEKRGVANAKDDIFKDSVCILTPTKNTKNESLKTMKEMWSKFGAKVVFMPPSVHDKVLSLVSHLPHIAAFALMHTVPDSYLKWTSTGFKSTTRIAASDSLLWRDIFLSNPDKIIEAIDLLQKKLSIIKSAISRKDGQALEKLLRSAKRKRDKISFVSKL
ncbi:MAG: prephenate dehydrogenase [Candidatus Omnitrophota bacterium]